jgi:hypothetical protein
MTGKISTDDMERVIDYLVNSYNNGFRFHKTHYMEEELGMPSNKIAKIMEQIKESKKVILSMYARRTWRIDDIQKGKLL